ncbi:MAG: RsmE family RNA methyltransferase, partial [Nannocystaceae bacterium]
RLGLEQARDTVRPTVSLQRRFLPFVQDVLPGWTGQGRRLLGHPRLDAEAPQPSREPTTVAIGPEGGWVPFEVEQFESAGFRCVSLGPRILRVETAVVALLARLGPV